eukprot:scaffold389329_cov21-Prasinocladus_malaysianus.AAC.1
MVPHISMYVSDHVHVLFTHIAYKHEYTLDAGYNVGFNTHMHLLSAARHLRRFMLRRSVVSAWAAVCLQVAAAGGGADARQREGRHDGRTDRRLCLPLHARLQGPTPRVCFSHMHACHASVLRTTDQT